MVAPEKLAMQTCTVDLIDGLASDNIGSLVDHLYNNRLMSVDVYDKIRLTMAIPRDKAREAVSHVSARVNADPEVTFRSFIKVLRDNGYSKLVKKLEDKFVEHGGDRTGLKQETHSSEKGASGRKRVLKDKKAAKGGGSKAKRPRGAASRVSPDNQEHADDNDSEDSEDDNSDSENEYTNETPEVPVKYGGKLPKKITDWESAEEDDSKVKRQCKAASRVQIDNQDGAEDEEAEIAVPTSLEDTNHIEKYKKAVRTISKANRDILNKDFPPGEHLCKVAEKIKSDWKTKFYLLNLEESDVNNIIEGRNRDNPTGQRQEALEIWRNKALPTYKNLLIVLIKGNWKDAEDVLVGLCTK